MASYQLILDDGASTDLMVETIEATDPAEAIDLARIRLSSAPDLIHIVVMRGSLEVATIERSH